MIDPRPAAFIGDDGADPEKDTSQVDVENTVPLREFVVLDQADVDDARVVDQDVDRAELVDRGRDNVLPVVGVGHVEVYVTGSTANVFGDRFAFGVQNVAEDDLGSLVDECPNMRGTHPTGTATDDGHLARQPTCHRFLLLERGDVSVTQQGSLAAGPVPSAGLEKHAVRNLELGQQCFQAVDHGILDREVFGHSVHRRRTGRRDFSGRQTKIFEVIGE